MFEFKRQILNAQLDAMVGWQEILAGRDNQVVVVQRLSELIPQAEEVQARKKTCRDNWWYFAKLARARS